jgi:hypothetical protein
MWSFDFDSYDIGFIKTINSFLPMAAALPLPPVHTQALWV